MALGHAIVSRQLAHGVPVEWCPAADEQYLPDVLLGKCVLVICATSQGIPSAVVVGGNTVAGERLFPDVTPDMTSMFGLFSQQLSALLENRAGRLTIERQMAEMEIAATAFDASQEGMMVTDASNRIVRVNRAFCEMTGYSAEEAIGQTPRILGSGLQDALFYEKLWASVNTTGAWRGEIWNRRKDGEIYPEYLAINVVRDARGNIVNHVACMADITQRKRFEDRIQRLAFYDHLTGLPNRSLLMDRLHQAMLGVSRRKRRGAVLFIDLDNFKTLNDTLGHAYGDVLLKQVADRLTECVRETDTVARLGGDEFVVLLCDLSHDPLDASEKARQIGEKIRVSLANRYELEQHEHICTPSIGVTMFHDGNEDVEEVLKQADIAMYEAKGSGRNTLCFFDAQMQASINERVRMEAELRLAVEDGQLRLYFQPQKNADGELTGAEALIRWQHPDRGIVSPAKFIPVAEESGLILPIGLWVVESACAQLKAWESDPETSDLVLSVNVSAKQFHLADFVEQITSIISRFGINPHRLKLELTETMLIGNYDEVIRSMQALADAGVQLSLDDFGTGYSSLQYLKRLPIHQLKIDQSFVRDISTDPGDLAIVKTIIAMAGSLGLEVIAEGVETEEQRQMLMACGCLNYQGYLFGRPMPIDEFHD